MKKILVVDDDLVLRKALTVYLTKRNYLGQEAGSGQEGLNKYESFRPDLIISDVVMPDMDGFSFCREVRSRSDGKLLPFIFLTVRTHLNDQEKVQAVGADDYLTKPIKLEELNLKIQLQLERAERINAEIVRLLQTRQTGSDLTAEEAEPPKLNSSDLTLDSPPESLPLTPSEERVFWKVIQGLTNKEISQHLHLSPRTVQTHLSNILSKLNLKNRTQLSYFAYQKGYQPHSQDQFQLKS
ncbi:two component transcriptional regulator, LuxR family [Halothece sp. PCC 7418]|uniref:response regulator transcription factor n=1 Tax=Halothece sp. (strain PCC 7418) TaxID=65093 RepID=UPI0002A06D44|nr:response regulator transcription factor [Halothece sp. PCC 7418]AFZ42838.1 two component transcriptional regulator, LuxR family [Halothece sp. PCC 7418]